MNNASEKVHELASILVSVEKVVEFDRLVDEFNNMLPTLRDHIQRIEDTNNGMTVLKTIHDNGSVEVEHEKEH